MNLNAPRTSHPSSAQVETLVEFMERNPGLAKGFLRTQNARERSRRQWEELAVRLNSLGGTIKNYKQWTKETNSPSSPIIQAIQDDGTDNIDVHQQQNLPVEEPSPVMILGSEQFVNTHDTPVARRLFHSSSSPAVGTSQHILQGFQSAETVLEDAHVYHPSLSPPGATLSHTPTPPVPIPSPSRRGSTQVVRDRYAASSSSRRATFDTQSNSTSRRTRPHIARSRRGAGSVSSHQTTAHPPSQRRTEFSTFTERFLRVEEQQLEIQRSNSHIVQSFLERSGERERALIEAVAAVGKGLEALARAIKRD